MIDPAKLDQLENIEDELDYDFSVNEQYIRSDEQLKEYLFDPFLDENRHIFYRGERIVSLKRPLLPSMFRNRNNLMAEEDLYVDVDAEYLYNHYQENGHYLDLFNSAFGTADIDCMYDICAFSQHYLEYSPLIDLSKSLYVALSFALKGKEEFEEDALLYTVEISDENNYTQMKAVADQWLKKFHVRVYNYKEGAENLRNIRRSSPEAKVIDIATNDRMKFQQGVFLLLDDFNLVNHLYLTKNVRESVSIRKYILDKDYCPVITRKIRKEAPWFMYEHLLDISTGIQAAVAAERERL